MGQINPEKAKEEFQTAAKSNGGSGGVKDFMDGMGLGMIADQVTLSMAETQFLIPLFMKEEIIDAIFFLVFFP